MMHTFVAGLIKKATRRIVMIDNYIDETVLTLLDKRSKGVEAVMRSISSERQSRPSG